MIDASDILAKRLLKLESFFSRDCYQIFLTDGIHSKNPLTTQENPGQTSHFQFKKNRDHNS